MDNPYQSPADGSRGATSFRFGRMLLIAIGLLLLVVAPIVWQANREGRARQQAAENLRQIGDALRQYQAREETENGKRAEAAERAHED